VVNSLAYNVSVQTNLLIPIFCGLLGGWSVNYLSDVLPHTRQLSPPVCPNCQRKYYLHEYLFFAPCPNCGQRRTARSFILQIFLLAASIYIWKNPPEALHYWLGFILLLYFATIFIIDLEHRLILHPTSWFGAGLALLAGWLKRGPLITLTGALGGFAIMYGFYLLGVLFAKIRTRRRTAAGLAADDEEALGFGDVILASILGLALGWPLIWFGLFLGILLGGGISILLIGGIAVSGQLKKKAWDVFLPYGPYFLVSATLLIYFPGLFK